MGQVCVKKGVDVKYMNPSTTEAVSADFERNYSSANQLNSNTLKSKSDVMDFSQM